MLTSIGHLLTDAGSTHPQRLLEALADRDTKTARALEDFFTRNQMALGLDWKERRAARRRHNRIESIPTNLQPAVIAFADQMLANRRRARRAATRPRKHATIEARLKAACHFACFLADRDKTDWALADKTDTEAFLAAHSSRAAWYLAGLRQFFAFALQTRRILIDPTAGLHTPQQIGFTGPTLTQAQQRELFNRWTSNETNIHPHEALVGLLALLHGATTTEIRYLRTETIDYSNHTAQLGRRHHATALDPWTWAALQKCVAHRETLGSDNPHVLVTLQSKATRAAPSDTYVKRTLLPVGLGPRILRSTRIVDLTASIDTKLIASAYGITNEAALAYLTDHVAHTRLPNP